MRIKDYLILLLLSLVLGGAIQISNRTTTLIIMACLIALALYIGSLAHDGKSTNDDSD